MTIHESVEALAAASRADIAAAQRARRAEAAFEPTEPDLPYITAASGWCAPSHIVYDLGETPGRTSRRPGSAAAACGTAAT